MRDDLFPTPSPSGQGRPAIRPPAPPQRVMPAVPPPPSQPSSIAAQLNKRILGANPSLPQPVSAFQTGGWGVLSLNTAGAAAEISSELSSLDSSLRDLQSKVSFSDAANDINSLDTGIQNAIQLAESARSEGYCYQKDIDNLVYQAKSQWDSIRPQVFQSLQQQSTLMQSRLPSLSPQVQRLNSLLGNPVAARPLLQTTQSQVNGLLQSVDQAYRNLQNSYSPVQTQVQTLTDRLNKIHWAMDQLVQARFKLADGELLVMAVAARWDKEGKEDPEGILYLSNRRLIFERKEKVATKKILFITTASELVQEVLIDQPLKNVQNVQGENKGLFGNQDFLQVQFSDSRLGNVSLHIRGQESKAWASLVERSRSGQIETERFSETGMSIADLTRPLTTADVVSLQNEVGQLQDDLMLKKTRQELAGLENSMRSLERDLANIRTRGYVIEKGLEGDISILSVQWDRVKANAESTLELQVKNLSGQAQNIQQMMAQFAGMSANLASAKPVFMQLKSAIASSGAQAEAAQATVAAQYSQYAQEVEKLSAHLDWVSWMLDALSTASFRLLATESGVAAVEACWGQPGLEPENGILFLTDQRLLWEDRVGSFELKVNIPLQSVQEVHKEIEGDPVQEWLAFTFAPGAPLPATRFQLSMPVAEDWLKMIGRARSGEYAQDRAIPLDPVEIERVRNAPQQCQKCGAALTAPILRGQQEITCEYCGLVIRI